LHRCAIPVKPDHTRTRAARQCGRGPRYGYSSVFPNLTSTRAAGKSSAVAARKPAREPAERAGTSAACGDQQSVKESVERASVPAFLRPPADRDTPSHWPFSQALGPTAFV